MIFDKVSVMRVSIPIDLYTRSFILLPFFFLSRRTPPLLTSWSYFLDTQSRWDMIHVHFVDSQSSLYIIVLAWHFSPCLSSFFYMVLHSIPLIPDWVLSQCSSRPQPHPSRFPPQCSSSSQGFRLVSQGVVCVHCVLPTWSFVPVISWVIVTVIPPGTYTVFVFLSFTWTVHD